MGAGFRKGPISILDLESPRASVQVINAQKPNELMKTRREIPGQNDGAKKFQSRIATWNTRTLNEGGTIELVTKELGQMKIDIIGIIDILWATYVPTMWEKNGYVIIHSPHDDVIYRRRVAFILTKEMADYLVSNECISSRLMEMTNQ